MEITLYPGEEDCQLTFFTNFFNAENIRYEINRCYIGYKILLYIQTNKLKVLASHICRFIFEYNLKEAVISKIYDEYPCFNTEDAALILSDISAKIISTPLNESICDLLKNKLSFNPESYCLFNIKPIMICVYALTDEVCQSFVFFKEKEKLVSVVRTFSNLSFNKCSKADVEFSSDNVCKVVLDKNKFSVIPNEELLSFLVYNAPGIVNIKNAEFNPDLADVVDEIFNSEKNK